MSFGDHAALASSLHRIEAAYREMLLSVTGGERAGNRRRAEDGESTGRRQRRSAGGLRSPPMGAHEVRAFDAERRRRATSTGHLFSMRYVRSGVQQGLGLAPLSKLKNAAWSSVGATPSEGQPSIGGASCPFA